MLVLNTNEWWKSLIQSNQNFLIAYPDFSGSLLFNMYWPNTFFSRNWTSIDFLSETINSINYCNWTIWTNADVWSETEIANAMTEYTGAQTKTATNTYTKKWMIGWEFNWWEIIWKNIIIPERWAHVQVRASSTVSSMSPTVNWTISWTIKIQLLHNDWTLTDVSSIILNSTYEFRVSSLYTSRSSWYGRAPWNIITTNWTVAQQGDILVADIDITHTIEFTLTSATTPTTQAQAALSLWKLWSIYNQYKPRPIQISIN